LHGAHAQAAEPQWGPVLLRLARLLNFHIQLAAQLLFPIKSLAAPRTLHPAAVKVQSTLTLKICLPNHGTEPHPVKCRTAQPIHVRKHDQSCADLASQWHHSSLDGRRRHAATAERLHGESQEHAHAKIKLSDHMTGPLSFSQALATPTPASQKMRLGRPR
jgi:hypothetical protein